MSQVSATSGTARIADDAAAEMAQLEVVEGLFKIGPK
jgi:hypothetical protein